MEESHPGQTALAERLLKAIETTLTLAALAAGRRPSKPEKKEGRRRA